MKDQGFSPNMLLEARQMSEQVRLSQVKACKGAVRIYASGAYVWLRTPIHLVCNVATQVATGCICGAGKGNAIPPEVAGLYNLSSVWTSHQAAYNPSSLIPLKNLRSLVL